MALSNLLHPNRHAIIPLDLLSDTDFPVLLMYGTEDWMETVQARKLATDFPHRVQLKTVEAGHHLHSQNADECSSTLLSFVNRRKS